MYDVIFRRELGILLDEEADGIGHRIFGEVTQQAQSISVRNNTGFSQTVQEAFLGQGLSELGDLRTHGFDPDRTARDGAGGEIQDFGMDATRHRFLLSRWLSVPG